MFRVLVVSLTSKYRYVTDRAVLIGDRRKLGHEMKGACTMFEQAEISQRGGNLVVSHRHPLGVCVRKVFSAAKDIR